MRALVFPVMMVCATAAAAQTPVTDVQTMAREIAVSAYAPASGADAAVANFEKEFVAGFKRSPNGAAVAQQRPDLLAAAVSAGKQEFTRQFGAVIVPRMIDAIADIYVGNFTQPELESIRGYYQTPQAKRFLSSFAAGNTEVQAAGADPVVVAYSASAVGLKEKSLSGSLTTAMWNSMATSMPRIMPAINAKVEAAMKAALAKSRNSQ